MTAYVDEKCIGCGMCTTICPEVFKMTDKHVARASGTIFPDQESDVQEAAENCPVNAIEV